MASFIDIKMYTARIAIVLSMVMVAGCAQQTIQHGAYDSTATARQADFQQMGAVAIGMRSVNATYGSTALKVLFNAGGECVVLIEASSVEMLPGNPQLPKVNLLFGLLRQSLNEPDMLYRLTEAEPGAYRLRRIYTEWRTPTPVGFVARTRNELSPFRPDDIITIEAGKILYLGDFDIDALACKETPVIKNYSSETAAGIAKVKGTFEWQHLKPALPIIARSLKFNG